MGWRERAVPDTGATGGGSWRSRAVAEPYGGLRDAVAEPPANPNFEVPGMSQTARTGTPAYLAPVIQPGPGLDISPTRALLTNEPTSGYVESYMRGVPAGIGGVVGGAAAGGLTAGAASIPGAVYGATAMEAARQTAVQLYSAASGREFSTPGQVFGNVALQGVMGGAGQGMGVGLAGVQKYVVKQTPAALKNSVGVPEPITQYVQKRGTANVFTPENLDDGAALTSVGKATSDLASRRAAVGQSIGNSEDFILDLGAGSNAIETGDIAAGLRSRMMKDGYIDPRTAGLVRGKDAGLLNDALETLQDQPTRQLTKGTPEQVSPLLDNLGRPIVKPAVPGVTSPGEPLTLRQAINTKRLIDSQLDFGGTLNREISDPAAAIAKNVNAQLRQRVRDELGPMIGKLYDDFGAIADAQEKLAEFTGTKALSNVEQRAVQALRGIVLKNPGEVENIVEVLGAGLPGGTNQARQIFDAIAADPFSKGGIGAPSNIWLKALTAGGTLSGPMARSGLRASESFGAANLSPAGSSFRVTAGMTPLAEAYLNRRLATP